MKQELIEEAKKLWQESHPNPIEMALFGAKWQQERMYSEEEVLVILDKFLTAMIKGEKTGLLEKWFEKIKKK